jgi:transcriptional repressor NrdR
MRCPKCNDERSSVSDSRPDDRSIRRRRVCQGCGLRFTTFERIEVSLPQIIKKDGRREPFLRDKIRRGLEMACQKLPISAETIERIIDSIEHELSLSSEREIGSEIIGELALNALQKVGPVAYVRFASVYKEFCDTKQFLEAVVNLSKD